MVNNWRDFRNVNDMDGQRVRVISRWKYRIMQASFMILVMLLFLMILVFTISAAGESSLISLNNGTITININHNIQFSQEFLDYVNQTIGGYIK